MFAVEAIGITKKYKDVTAVDNLYLQIYEGELFALLGTNGAGKTTAIKMFSNLTMPTNGDVLIMNHNAAKEGAKVKKIIGVSPQETAVAPNLSVKENLEFICGLYGFNKAKREAKVDEISRQFKLSEILTKKAGKLSGGWQRRLSIAMALISEPSVIFLDEPTLGLDVIARSELWDLISMIKGRITIILTTHYMQEAEALSDRIGIMKNGKLLTVGSAQELMTKTNTDNFENAFISIVREVDI